jgi:fructosamine-3-kinase
MTAFSERVAALAGVEEGKLERLAGGDLSEVLLVPRADGRLSVAKGGAAVSAEATMLRTLAGAGVPAPMVEGEHDGVLMLEYVANDGVFSPHAWADIGAALQILHDRTSDSFGWPTDYRIGTVELDNRQRTDWPAFWGEQRLIATASVLDRPWRERIDTLAGRLHDLLPARPVPSLLHGDLWTGNLLVRDGRLAAFIDPACYFGHAEVDLAMLSLFDTPPDEFWAAYGAPDEGWEDRRSIYQIFPAIMHLRLFGPSYASMVDRLLAAAGV